MSKFTDEQILERHREKEEKRKESMRRLKEWGVPALAFFGVFVVLAVVYFMMPSDIGMIGEFFIMFAVSILAATAALLFVNMVFSTKFSPLMKPMVDEIEKREQEGGSKDPSELAKSSAIIGLGNRILFGFVFSISMYTCVVMSAGAA